MKILLFISFFVFSTFITNGQAEQNNSIKVPNDSLILNGLNGHLKDNPEIVFVVVEKMPEFPGGEIALYNYLNQNIKYPVAAYLNKVEGRVFVQFVIDTSGQISNVIAIRGIGYGCDQEAIRIITSMPEWEPGYQKGKPVKVRFNIPVRFTIDEQVKIKMDEADPLYLQAKENFNNGDYSKSMKLLDETLELNPCHINALQLRALLFSNNNDSIRACEDLNFANGLWQEMMKNYFESICPINNQTDQN